MRRAARTDANKAAIVAALRSRGASVYDLKAPVDLLVGLNGKTRLVEIKDGAKPPSRQAYTPAQVAFMALWTGEPVETVRSVAEALALCERMAQNGAVSVTVSS